VLVGGIVVHDGVDQLASWHRRLDRVEEAQELLVAVALHAAAQHRAAENVQCCEQGRCAVPAIVMGHGRGLPLLHRQPQLRAVKCLDRALLVDRQHAACAGGLM
jgi:hypothetical protein